VASGFAGKTCIVGIGETAYTRWGKATKSEFALAVEAIRKAIADAGLRVEDIDGFASYSNDRNEPVRLANGLGLKSIGFANMMWGGGGGGACAAVGNAAAAVHAGFARYVVAFRSLAQGQFGRFGQSRAGGRVGGEAQFVAPFGALTPAHYIALQTRRHMHEYGTRQEHLGAVAIAAYKHAQRNPRAVMYGRPLTMEQYLNARMIVDPFRLYDCCLESDGAAAVVVTTAERARDLPQKPAYILGAAQGTGYRESLLSPNKPAYTGANFSTVAARLWAQCGLRPTDVDVAQIYENFTGAVLMSLEDNGFCKKGEAGPFVEGGRIEHPDVADPGAPYAGELPINTSGGNLAEAYIHGFELVVEAVRQIRGTSTCQVKDARLSFVAAGPCAAPVSNLLLGTAPN
jgi:acetyl-CoA acetyltransferase